jgi:signal transduction histidine kinase/DNA-binding response OmpR family regulator
LGTVVNTSNEPQTNASLDSPHKIEVLDPDDGFGVGSGTDILVVDDDEGTLVAYTAALEPLGRRVVVAKSGVDAVARLLEQDFALMLLDVAMPGMSGLETARLARQRPRNKGLPIIFLTGEASSTQLIVEAYDIGASDFVIKPITPEVLRAKARVYLQLQERTQSLVDYARQLHEAQQQADRSEALRADGAEFAATARRLAKLQEATAALARAKTPEDVASVAVRLGAEAVDATGAAMWIAGDDDSLILVGQHGYPEGYLDPWTSIPHDAAVPVARAFNSRQPIWAQNESEYRRVAVETYDYARERGGPFSFAAFPLGSNGHALGVLVLIYDREHTFPDEEREFLLALARACEQALDRSRLYVLERTARQAAEESNRRKDEFLAMLGHELRNPLAAMVTAFALLKTRDGELPRELAIIDRQTSHLSQLVNDLVDVARVTRGAITLKREPVRLSSAVTNALELARPVLDQHAHDLVVSVPSDVVVDADRERIAQVLAHLITNAAKYTPGKGRIEIAVERAEAFARIEIRDNGMGIPPALLSSLFEPFVQGERALDRHQGGLGVGLTIVRTLVELHGGRVEAHSEGAGKGSTLTLLWPMSSGRTRTGEVRALIRPAIEPRAFKVLVVDDNVDAADVLASLLSVLGHEVDVAYDGVSAVEHALAFQPDIAFLDIGLPERDGYALAAELRGIESLAHTVLIAVTGYGQPEDRERALRAGFSQHYVKPMDLRTITALFERLSESLSS